MFLVITDGSLPTQENRADIIGLFDAIGVIHGEWFDDGRKWCGGCAAPTCVDPVVNTIAAGKVCKECHSIWPEHVEEFTEMLLDPDSDDELGDMLSHTIN